MTTVAEFVAKFGIQVDNQSVKGFNESVTSIGARIRALRTSLALVTAGLGASEFARFSTELANTAQSVGVTARQLFELRFAAKAAGQSVGEVSAITTRVASVLDKVRIGLPLDPNFARGLGTLQQFSGVAVNIKKANGELKNTGELLGDIFDALEQVPDPARQVSISKDVLGQQNILPLLQQLPRAREASRDIDFDRREREGRALTQSLTALRTEVQNLVAEIAPSTKVFVDALMLMAKALTSTARIMRGESMNPLIASQKIADETTKVVRNIGNIFNILRKRGQDEERRVQTSENIRLQPEVAAQFAGFRAATAPEPVVQNITNVQNFLDPDATIAQQLLPLVI